MTPEEAVWAAAKAIKKEIQELGRGDHQVEYRMFGSTQWEPITVEDVYADGVMLRIEGPHSQMLCAPTQFGATFRRVPKLAVVPG